MKVGVLALQGAFIEHEKKLEKLGVECIELRQKKDLEQDFDGLILPGGESTVQGKLLKELDMFDILQKRIQDGLPTIYRSMLHFFADTCKPCVFKMAYRHLLHAQDSFY